MAASYGGRDDIPHWYNNLQTNDNYITVENSRSKVEHILISDEDIEKYWEFLINVYSTFANYIERTNRKLPLVEFIEA